MQQPWLNAVSWESILTLNKALCQAQKVEPSIHAGKLDQARQLWEAAGRGSLTLKQALDLCRQCYELKCFVFNNGNTFAAAGRTMLEEHLKSLPPVEAQIIRTTVSHYVVGLIGRRELMDVLRHYQTVWESATRPVPAIKPQPVTPSLLSEVQPQV